MRWPLLAAGTTEDRNATHLCARIDAQEGYPGTQLRKHVVRVLFDIRAVFWPNDVARLGNLGVDIGVGSLVGVDALPMLRLYRRNLVYSTLKTRAIPTLQWEGYLPEV